MNKVIVFDCGFMTHRAIFCWGSAKKRNLEQGISEDPVPASYGYLNAIYGTLKKIGITKDDKIIFAQDGWNSFRRAFLPAYKAQRKAFRESHEEIDWKKQYAIINNLEKALHNTTNWNFIQLNEVFNFADLCLTEQGQEFKIEDYDIDFATEYGIEADDIMAIVPKIFPKDEVVLVTIDKDFSQLYYYDNVKIFNPNLQSPTNKAKKGYYEIVSDPLGIISKKVRLGDVSDNILVDKKNDTEHDVEIRKFIIDMLRMPKYVEKPICDALNKLDWDKKTRHEELPFENSLAKKFDTIYESKNIRSWDESVKRHEKKEVVKKEKAKIAYQKQKAKKKAKV